MHFLLSPHHLPPLSSGAHQCSCGDGTRCLFIRVNSVWSSANSAHICRIDFKDHRLGEMYLAVFFKWGRRRRKKTTQQQYTTDFSFFFFVFSCVRLFYLTVSKRREMSMMFFDKTMNIQYISPFFNGTNLGGNDVTWRTQSHLSLQRAFCFLRGLFVIITNVIALLLLKDRGLGEKRIMLRDIKYVPSINAGPTSLIYVPPPPLLCVCVCDFLTWWSHCIPLTLCMSHVSRHNNCCSLLPLLKWKWALTPGRDCIAEQGLLQRSMARDDTLTPCAISDLQAG